MYKLHSVCRCCGYGTPKAPPGIKSPPDADKLIPVFSLGFQPLSNAFAREDELQSAHYPLKVLFCPRCTLGQLSIVVPPGILYKKYAYTTSRSVTMLRHFESLLSYMRSEQEPDSVIEIGSNDGYFLEYLKKNGAGSVCGIDPSENLSEVARSNMIQTICGVFDKNTARMAADCVPAPDAIIARHVFGHVSDLRDFIKSLDLIAGNGTLIIIEVPWAKRLLERCEFDTVYFEHLSYFTIKSIVALLDGTPFRLHKIHEFPVHGGALGIMIRRRDHESTPNESVQNMLSQENINNSDWEIMSECSARAVDRLVSVVRNAISEGKTVAGYGASAKMTVLLNACKFTRREINFVTDTTPQKQLCCIPGTDIPVVDPGAILRELPDFTILGAWNFATEIFEKESLYREKGGQFINPHEQSTTSAGR